MGKSRHTQQEAALGENLSGGPNPQSVCGLGCTLLNPVQILLNHLLTQSNFLKTSSQIDNLLLKLDVLLVAWRSLPLRETHASQGEDKTV
jgi:hypothetical protein